MSEVLSLPDIHEDTHQLLYAGWSIARGLGAIVGPTIGATLYRPAPADGKKTWGSAGSPGLVSLVAASLAVSAVSGLLIAHVPTAQNMLLRLTGSLKRQSPSPSLQEATTDAARNDEYEMKPIQGEWIATPDRHISLTLTVSLDSCFDRMSSLPRV